MNYRIIVSMSAMMLCCSLMFAQTPDSSAKRIIVKPKREVPVKVVTVQPGKQQQTDSAKINPGRQETIPTEKKKKTKKKIR